MKHLPDFMAGLARSEVEQILGLSEIKSFAKGELILVEGDQADMFYILAEGRVSIYLDHNGDRHELRQLSAGDYFGEMALLNNDKRSASVVAQDNVVLYGISKTCFKELTQSHPELTARITRHIVERSEELILREHLVKITGITRYNLHIGIGGDPTMRETALYRERRTSEADRVIDALVEAVGDVLLNRCVYHLIVNLNSGEIRTNSVFTPFIEEVHIARQFAERPYIERHFPLLPYDRKIALMRSIQSSVMATAQFAALPEQWQHIYSRSFHDWNNLDEKSIWTVISKIKELRNIESLYLRNILISITQDAIRMQFNCDGTHIVDAVNFEKFIEENI